MLYLAYLTLRNFREKWILRNYQGVQSIDVIQLTVAVVFRRKCISQNSCKSLVRNDLISQDYLYKYTASMMRNSMVPMLRAPALEGRVSQRVSRGDVHIKNAFTEAMEMHAEDTQSVELPTGISGSHHLVDIATVAYCMEKLTYQPGTQGKSSKGELK